MEQVEDLIKRSNNDFQTANFMFNNKRYLYTMLMCNLAVESALKALYISTKSKEPSEGTDALTLSGELGLKTDENDKLFSKLREISHIANDADDMGDISRNFTKDSAQEIINQVAPLLDLIKSRIK